DTPSNPRKKGRCKRFPSPDGHNGSECDDSLSGQCDKAGSSRCAGQAEPGKTGKATNASAEECACKCEFKVTVSVHAVLCGYALAPTTEGASSMKDTKCVPTRSERCTMADNFATRSGGVARAKRRCDWGIKMCHSSRRSTLSSSACLAAMIGLITLTASAQTPKKESVWDKIKKAGQQGAAQGQQPQQQPQPGQQPAQRQDGRGRPSPPNQSQVNDSGPIKPPAGTKIEEKIMAPMQERAQF